MNHARVYSVRACLFMKELSDSLEAVICLAPFKHTERSNNVRSRMGDAAFPRVNKPFS